MTRYYVDVNLTVLWIPVDAASEAEAAREAIRHIQEDIFHASGSPEMWRTERVTVKEEEA